MCVRVIRGTTQSRSGWWERSAVVHSASRIEWLQFIKFLSRTEAAAQFVRFFFAGPGIRCLCVASDQIVQYKIALLCVF